MERRLFTFGVPCTMGCKYCFASSKGFLKPAGFELDSTSRPCVVYPLCDSDIIHSYNDLFSVFEKIYENVGPYIVSLSTKGDVSIEMIERLLSIRDKLLLMGGLLKVSVSISSRSLVGVLEPKATSYEKRIESLMRLSEREIPTSLVIKPIIPFVSSEEYVSILEDVVNITKYVLIGDLYVFPGELFYESYIKNKYHLQKKKVKWVIGNPEWFYVESVEQKKVIKLFAKENGLMLFESDFDFLQYLYCNMLAGEGDGL